MEEQPEQAIALILSFVDSKQGQDRESC